MLSAPSTVRWARTILGAKRGRHRSRSLRLLLVLLGLALVANSAFAMATNRQSATVVSRLGVESAKIVLAVPFDDRTVLAATVSDELLLLEDGRLITSARFAFPITGVARDTHRPSVYVGTGDGKVSVLAFDLGVTDEIAVAGRVVGVAPLAAGGFVVAHGADTSGGGSFVSAYAAPGATPAFVHEVDFTVTALDSRQGLVAYGTGNGRVGALGAGDGQPLWEIVVRRPVAALAVVPDGSAVLTGDDRGNLTLLDAETGSARWETNVSLHPLRSVAYDMPTNVALAGDAEGGVSAVVRSGQRAYSEPAASAAPVEAILPAKSGLTAIPREGAWLSVRPAAVTGAALASQIRVAWYASNGLLGILAIPAAIAAVPPWRTRAKRLRVLLGRSRTAYAFLLPSICLIAIFNYYPMAMAGWYSLTDASSRNITQFVGLRNYVAILTDDFYFRTGIANMLLILATDVLKVLTISLLTAELVFWVRNRTHRYVFRTLVVGSAVVPGLVTTLLWRLIYAPNVGLIDQGLAAVGLDSLQRAWLGDERTAIWAIIGAGFPFLSAFAFLIYLGGLLDINPELHDAAQIDGANWLRRFLHIDVPLLAPQFRLLLFFTFLGAVQGFASIYVLTGGGPGYATYVPALQMYLRIAERGDFGYASAIGIVLTVVVLFVTLALMRFRREVDLLHA